MFNSALSAKYHFVGLSLLQNCRINTLTKGDLVFPVLAGATSATINIESKISRNGVGRCSLSTCCSCWSVLGFARSLSRQCKIPRLDMRCGASGPWGAGCSTGICPRQRCTGLQSRSCCCCTVKPCITCSAVAISQPNGVNLTMVWGVFPVVL